MKWIHTPKKERISTTVSIELAKKARQEGIKFSYALSMGIRHLLKNPIISEDVTIEDLNKKLYRQSILIERLVKDVTKLEDEKK